MPAFYRVEPCLVVELSLTPLTRAWRPFNKVDTPHPTFKGSAGSAAHNLVTMRVPTTARGLTSITIASLVRYEHPCTSLHAPALRYPHARRGHTRNPPPTCGSRYDKRLCMSASIVGRPVARPRCPVLSRALYMKSARA